MVGPGRRLGEAKLQVRGIFDLAQDLKRRVHHFWTNAVAGKHGNVERIVSRHRVSLGCEARHARAVPGIHVLIWCRQKTWMAGTRMRRRASRFCPAMTKKSIGSYGVSTARPTSLPFCRSTSASLAFASGIGVTGIGSALLAG